MRTTTDILLIEDDRDLVETLRIVMESKGYTVRVAYDGKDGFNRVAEKIPDLIVLDVMMATDTDGFDLACKLNHQPEYRDIPIIMVTGFPKAMVEKGSEPFQHILGEAWPVSIFFEKPVDPENLLTTIADLLKARNQA